MKCGACGYEKEINHYNSEKSINPDGQDFQRIESGVKSGFTVPGDDFSDSPKEMGLYICPKCGTVHAEEVW